MQTYSINGKEFLCPLQLALHAMNGKWKGIIVWLFLYDSPVFRYGELKHKIDELEVITDRMLIQSLKELERDELIERKAYAVVPPKVEYRLTSTGKHLKAVIDALERFGNTYEVSRL